MMNKVIASMVRFFHALFWLLLFGGILISKSIRVSTICTAVVLVAILLWDILGYCFVSILENQFDPSRINIGGVQADDDASVLQRYGVPGADTMGKAFNYLIYLVLSVGLLRIYGFIQSVKY